MKLQLPYGETMTAEYTTAEVKDKLLVIGNEQYFPYNEYAYKQFCKEAGYMDYYECEEDYKETPIINNESLLAYAHFNKAKWVSIDLQIKFHYGCIAELNNLKGEL